jgi:hypothetical protein
LFHHKQLFVFLGFPEFEVHYEIPIGNGNDHDVTGPMSSKTNEDRFNASILQELELGVVLVFSLLF